MTLFFFCVTSVSKRRFIRLKQFPLIAYISLFSVLIPIVAGVYKYRVITRKMKILLFLLIIAFATDISVTIFWGSQITPWLVHIYVLIEACLVLLIISYWQESKRMKIFFKVIIGLFIVVWSCSKFTFETFSGYFYLTGSIESALLTLCAGYTLFIVIGNSEQPLLSQYRFWVLLSFILYFMGTLMPIAMQAILFNRSKEVYFIAWSITWILSIISNILFTVGFLCPQTRT